MITTTDKNYKGIVWVSKGVTIPLGTLLIEEFYDDREQRFTAKIAISNGQAVVSIQSNRHTSREVEKLEQKVLDSLQDPLGISVSKNQLPKSYRLV